MTKKNLLLLMMIAAVFMFSAMQAACQNENSDLPQQARSVVSALAAGQFSRVESQYNSAMKAAMPAGKLATAWNSLLEQAGEFKSITGTRQEERAGLRAVLVSSQFVRGNLDIRIVFDGQGLITGLFFVPPAAPVSVAKAADYPVKPADVAGDWLGTLDAGMKKVRLVFHVTSSAQGLKATMDSPDQGVTGLVATAQLNGASLKIELKQFGISYEGTVSRDYNTVDGTYVQGLSASLVLKRVQDKEKAALTPKRRPQDPVRPYPYREEDVSYNNTAPGQGDELAATLTLPPGKGPFPAVLLLTGSGPQDRDETLMGHRPFLVLSDYLTRRGIAVLRADDRGVGKSTGDFATATTADFATDAEAGISYLKTRPEVNKKMIGLVGHSEGAIIAPMVAARNPDVAFIVMLAGSALPGDHVIAAQSGALAEAKTGSHAKGEQTAAEEQKLLDLVKRSKDDPAAGKMLRDKLAAIVPTAEVEPDIQKMQSPWYMYFIGYDPATALRKVTCPVLALNGSKDLQVLPAENLPVIRKALETAGNKNIDVEELPGLNHLFQTAKTGAIDEYPEIEETIAPVALKKIAGWVQKTTAQTVTK